MTDDWFERALRERGAADDRPAPGSPDDERPDFDAFGEGNRSDDEEFEAFESDVPRIDLGVEGLDSMIRGGVPDPSLMVVIGSPGTGKTTFGLQFLREGLRAGDRAIFIALEQSRAAVLSAADERDWDFETAIAEDRLVVVDMDPIQMANSLDTIQAELPALIEQFGAGRLVLDSVSMLEMMYTDQASRRIEIHEFAKALKTAGVSACLTSEASERAEFASRYGIIEYLTDAVVLLRYVRVDNRETRLALEILKIRNTSHSRETRPYELTDDGILVYQTSIF